MLSSWRPEDQRVLCGELASYCSAVKGQDWGLLSLVFWTISPPPTEGTSRTFSRKALESIGKAYMRRVDITFDDLDSALVALSNRRGQPKIDHHELIAITLLCVEHIIASGKGGGGIGFEGLLRMLTGCEVALRTAIPQNESTEIIRKIRVDTQKAIKGLLPDFKVEWYRTYFEELLKFDIQTNVPSYDGCLDILDTFGPLVRQIWESSPRYWEKCVASEWRSVSGEPRAKRYAACETFNTFVLETDQVFCQTHT
ncbi:hypothetical protein FRC01_006730 [Tulasnella sp. 417]|nr:hypothetical protein FRC01_006730 [Tulasnella sp. 417]